MDQQIGNRLSREDVEAFLRAHPWVLGDHDHKWPKFAKTEHIGGKAVFLPGYGPTHDPLQPHYRVTAVDDLVGRDRVEAIERRTVDLRLAEFVRRAKDQLSSSDRRVLEWRFWPDESGRTMTFREIGGLVGKSGKTASYYVDRAIDRLMAAMAGFLGPVIEEVVPTGKRGRPKKDVAATFRQAEQARDYAANGSFKWTKEVGEVA